MKNLSKNLIRSRYVFFSAKIQVLAGEIARGRGAKKFRVDLFETLWGGNRAERARSRGSAMPSQFSCRPNVVGYSLISDSRRYHARRQTQKILDSFKKAAARHCPGRPTGQRAALVSFSFRKEAGFPILHLV